MISENKEAPKGFLEKLLDHVPPVALGSIGTLFAFALVLKVLGIDFAGPINGISEAYTSAIRAQTEGLEKFSQATDRMESIIDSQRLSINELNANVNKSLAQQGEAIKQVQSSIDSLNDLVQQNIARIAQLESLSHPK